MILTSISGSNKSTSNKQATPTRWARSPVVNDLINRFAGCQKNPLIQGSLYYQKRMHLFLSVKSRKKFYHTFASSFIPPKNRWHWMIPFWYLVTGPIFEATRATSMAFSQGGIVKPSMERRKFLRAWGWDRGWDRGFPNSSGLIWNNNKESLGKGVVTVQNLGVFPTKKNKTHLFIV